MLTKATLSLALTALAAAGAAAETPPPAPAHPATTPAPAPTSEGWRFMIAPYMWGPNTVGDLTLGPISSEAELPLTTALKQLKGALYLRGEARKDRIGLAADFTYLKVAKGGAFSVPLPEGSTTDGDLAVRINLLEAWPSYRLGDDANAFDLFAGIRYYSFRTEIEFKTVGLDATREFNWTDPLVGLRWKGEVSPKLALTARADLAGFGAGSKLTLNLQGGVYWQFSQLAGLVVQYRWMNIDYEKGEPTALDFFKFDSSMHGVVVGVPFTW